MSETPRGPQSGAGPAFVAPVVAEERQGISRRRRLAARLEPTPPAAAPIDVARAPGAPDQPARVAIFVAHGMGQQVKFETLGTLATALRREAMRRGQNVPTVAVRMLRYCLFVFFDLRIDDRCSFVIRRLQADYKTG